MIGIRDTCCATRVVGWIGEDEGNPSMEALALCYGALAMCMIGCAGPPTPSKYRMYHTLVAAPAFLVTSTIGPSATVLL
jgi:hypothetical protein